MNLLELFKSYNSLLERQQKAIKYFEEKPDLVDSLMPKYKEVVDGLCRIKVELAKLGYVMSSDEIVNGFRQVKSLNL